MINLFFIIFLTVNSLFSMECPNAETLLEEQKAFSIIKKARKSSLPGDIIPTFVLPTGSTLNDFVQDCLSKQPLKVELTNLQSNSCQEIYVVKDESKSVFFLKVYKSKTKDFDPHELELRMQKFRRSRLGRLAHYVPHTNIYLKTIEKSLPLIAQPEAFVYWNKSIVEVIHAARGESLNTILTKSIKDYDYNKIAQEAFYAAGKALGSMHQHLAINPNDPLSLKTILHGDFNLNNVFFDFSCKKIFLIDCESSVDCLDTPQPIDWDIEAFIFIPILYWWKMFHKERLTLFTNFCCYFLRGYVSTFPASIQLMLACDLKKMICRWIGQAIACLDNAFQNPQYFFNNEQIDHDCFLFVHQFDTASAFSYPIEAIWQKHVDRIYQTCVLLSNEKTFCTWKKGSIEELKELFKDLIDILVNFDKE